jgi:hypothetical protein
LIGALIRTEEQTMKMMSQQQPQGTNNANFMPFPQQFVNDERRAMEQYGDMRSLADRMNKQMQGIAQGFQMDRYNPNNYHATQMNPPYNDPVQRQF